MPLIDYEEALGRVAGRLLAPITATVSTLRRARMFHPDAAVYLGRVEPATDTPWPAVAARLAGPALLRVSSAWWRGRRELPDALGLAVRFRAETRATAAAARGDQDLLLATIRHPWTTTLAPLRTHVHDFLDNDYYGVSPFDVDGIGRVYLRAVASRPRADGRDRGERFARAVAAGRAWWRLEARRAGTREWQPIATVRAVERVAVDETALRFWPFRSGRGLRPRGFVHALREAAYRASFRARPHAAAVEEAT